MPPDAGGGKGRKTDRMASDDFRIDLLRVIAAELYFSVGLQAARDMYGKSYASLGLAEKNAVDQFVMAQVAANYNALTPEFLRNQISRTTGSPSPEGSSKVN